MGERSRGIYDLEFVRGLFDEMSQTYGAVNLIASFGFSARWRRQCIEQVQIRRGDVVVDFMSGMGELWPGLSKKIGQAGQLRAIDFSGAMCARSRATAKRIGFGHVDLRQEDALENSFEDESADMVVSSFGLKTFAGEALERLAREVARILRPGGRLAFVEISVPPFAMLRWPFMAYLRYVVPVIGRLFLGNPDNYRLLSQYTSAFKSSDAFARHCRSFGLNVGVSKLFFGCATGVFGDKPARTDNREVIALDAT